MILGSSVFPAACRFLSFWSRNLKSFWQKQRFGCAWAINNSYGFQFWGNTKKKHVFNTYTFPSTMVMGAGNTNEFPCHFGIFMRIHMRVPMCLWKHIPNVEIFGHHVYRCGNTSLTHMALQSLFMYLCENTCSLTCSGSVKSRNTCAFPCFPL